MKRVHFFVHIFMLNLIQLTDITPSNSQDLSVNMILHPVAKDHRVSSVDEAHRVSTGDNAHRVSETLGIVVDNNKIPSGIIIDEPSFQRESSFLFKNCESLGSNMDLFSHEPHSPKASPPSLTSKSKLLAFVIANNHPVSPLKNRDHEVTPLKAHDLSGVSSDTDGIAPEGR